MEDPKKQLVSAVKQANNILVTVRSGPSIDQLAACIALTLMLNELGKHATAVFSGEVPSVMDFLEPEKTLEKNADSLQDFIISLDKAKADKLRYKVEDTVVKIFITPYRTSLSAADLEFGQGDYNVDLIIALGVHAQADLDEAITAHGRILHDAVVISINTEDGVAEDLGSVNWIEKNASSLSEVITLSSDELLGDKKDVLDEQIATALLTGIVAETERFGNGKTSPETMHAAAKLLTAGANQELVATKLTPRPIAEQPVASSEDGPAADIVDIPQADDTAGATEAATPGDGAASEPEAKDPGSLSIDHHAETADVSPEGGEAPVEPLAAPVDETSPVAETMAEPTAEPAAEQPAHPPTLLEIAASHAPLTDLGSAHQDDQSKSDDFVLGLTGAAAAALEANQATTYDLNRISIPASAPVEPIDKPVWPALPNELHAPAAPAQPVAPAPHADSDEQAALEVLKEHQAVGNERLKIQPLRDQNNFLGEPPLHDKKKLAPESGKDPVDSTLDATKFAITPPSLGGTLTASHDQSYMEPSTDPLSNNLATHRMMLSHDPHDAAPKEQESFDTFGGDSQEPQSGQDHPAEATAAPQVTPAEEPKPDEPAADVPADVKPEPVVEPQAEDKAAEQETGAAPQLEAAHPAIEAAPADPEPAPEPVAEEPAAGDAGTDGKTEDHTDITKMLLEAQPADPEPAAQPEKTEAPGSDKPADDKPAGPSKPLEAALAAPGELTVDHQAAPEAGKSTDAPAVKHDGPAPQLEAAVEQHA